MHFHRDGQSQASSSESLWIIAAIRDERCQPGPGLNGVALIEQQIDCDKFFGVCF